MPELHWDFIQNSGDFDLGTSGASHGVWHGCDALCFQGEQICPVLLRDPISMDSYRLSAEVACTPDSFVGLVFGAADEANFELVYVSADNEWGLPNLQYDPVMNASSTWQIYHGPRYQALVSVPHEQWVKLSLEVCRDSISIYVGEMLQPNLVIRTIRHERIGRGKIGVWGSFPSCVRNLVVNEIEADDSHVDTGKRPTLDQTFVNEWSVRKLPEQRHIRAFVEENGTLNLNRIFTSEPGAVVQSTCAFNLTEEQETILSFGFSDALRLWINDVDVFCGEWKWSSPGDSTDGRIRPDYISVRIRWQAGLNTIRAEVASLEGMYGWGLSVKTGLVDVIYVSQ